MVTQQAIVTFTTKLANLAQSNEPYQLVETVAGRNVIVKGTGYKLNVFSINGANYLPQDILSTRNKFKRYIASSLNEF